MPDRTTSSSVATAADLRHYVRWYDDSLPVAFCEKMIAAFRQATANHVKRERGWRAGLEESAWTELDITPLADAALKEFFTHKINESLARYNDDVGLPILIPGSSLLAPLRIKCYLPDAGEGFQLHFDSIGEVANRYLVFLWYLNDVEIGGETEFSGLELEVRPKAGRLLMFPPYWMYQHSGRPPVSGEKFILSTYMLFPMVQL
ncbi:MAG: 2OG-Fe(II) oxygenase [Rhodanobacteraceae bacterium]|nr:MAG: 2OG-Fe(II) oxygenase [Rhodanobacteraceae bacterium]